MKYPATDSAADRRSAGLAAAALLLCCAALLPAPRATAEAGDWLVRGGFHSVDPKSDNGDIVEVDAASMFTFDVTYLLTEHWGIELLAAAPFEHDIALVDGPTVATTKHLPPTLSVVYRFLPGATVHPYVGAGLNWTVFFDESTRGPLSGADLSLDDSFGVAAVVGVDIELGPRWFLNADVRYLDIDSDAELNGAELETVAIDPLTVGLNLGYRF